MQRSETLKVVARLNLANLTQAREGQADVWHDAIGHLRYTDADAAAIHLTATRGSDSYGQVKPADVLAVVTELRRRRVHDALGGPNGTLPAPPPEVDPDDVGRYLAWQQAWVQAAGDGCTAAEAERVADLALDVVRKPQVITQRPTAAIAAQVASALRAPGTRDRDDDAAAGAS